MREFNYIVESGTVAGKSITPDPMAPVLEAAIADMRVKDVNVIYPLIRAINSNKLTRNNTLYTGEALIGRKNNINPRGYSSWVMPHPKPVITNHNLTGGMFEAPDTPMGRIMFASYKKHTHPTSIIPAGKGMPGFVEGDGAMYFVAPISDQQEIPKVLGGAYYTVSIGSMAGKIIESISGQDLVALKRQGKDWPAYNKGDKVIIDGKECLCYWEMHDLDGREVSFVNVPSDTHGFVVDPNIGTEGLRVLLGEKKVGSKEFSFFDALTLEKVMELSSEEHAAFARALETIPETLAENAGLDPIEILTELKKRHEAGDTRAGLNLIHDKIEDTFAAGIIEPLQVKSQAIAAASEVAMLLLRVDDVLISKGTRQSVKADPMQGLD